VKSMLHLILGPDHKVTTDAVLTRLLNNVKSGRSGQFLIVPEQFSFEMERLLCRKGGDSISRYAEVLSLSRLANRVEAHCGGTANLWLDDGGRLLMAAQAVEHVHSKLKLFASACRKPEFLEMLLSFVDELENYGISPERFSQLSVSFSGRFAEKLQELGLLYESYLAVCAQAKDPALRLQNLKENLYNSDYASGKDFYICHFFDFTVLEQEIIEELTACSDSVTVAFTWEKTDDVQVFSAAADSARALENFCNKNNIQTDRTYLDFDSNTPEDLLFLQKHISGISSDVFSGKKSNVSFMKFDSMEEECRYTALEICKLIKSGARYRDIAIICGQYAAYGPTLEQILDLANISYYSATKEDMTFMGGTRMLLNALRAVSSNFDKESVIDYLKSGASGLSADQCDLLENYAVLWNINGKKWFEEWTWHPDGIGTEWKEEHQNALSDLNIWRKTAIEPLMELKAGLKTSDDVSDMACAVYEFTAHIQLPDRMQTYADKLFDMGQLQRSQHFSQIYDILIDALEQMALVLKGCHRSVDEFCTLFEKLISRYSVSTVPAALDEVQTGEASALRGKQFAHVFVLGANEGSFPVFSHGEGVFTEDERQQLIAAGLTMAPLLTDSIDREIGNIYCALRSAEKTLHLSCCDEPSYIMKRGEALFSASDPSDYAEILLNADEFAAAVLRGDIKTDNEDVLKSANMLRERREYNFGNIRQETIERLYGKELSLSASKIDKIASCRFAYFLRYGIRAEERKEVRFDASAFGTFVHDILEHLVPMVMEQGGFAEVTEEKLDALALQAMDEYARKNLADLMEKDPKFKYQMQRNEQETLAVVHDLGEELRVSRFEPASVELKFGRDGKMPPISFSGQNAKATLMGFVDRVDLYRHNDVTYVRVVDYKTGSKDFDYADISVGEGMQMLIYLFALKQNGQIAFGEKLQPAGVLYHMARQDILSDAQKLSEEDAAALHQKAKTRKGLIRDDDIIIGAMEEYDKSPKYLPFSVKKDAKTGDLCSMDEMRLLENHVFSMLGKLADEIVSGTITPNPIIRDAMNSACTYCEFHDACQKDLNKPDSRKLKRISNRKFFEDLERGAYTDGKA